MEQIKEEPQGDLILRTQAMPADTNPNGDIFGGWILSQMDIAGGILAKEVTRGRRIDEIHQTGQDRRCGQLLWPGGKNWQHLDFAAAGSMGQTGAAQRRGRAFQGDGSAFCLCRYR